MQFCRTEHLFFGYSSVFLVTVFIWAFFCMCDSLLLRRAYVCLKAVRNFVNCQVLLSVLHDGYRNQVSHLRGSYDDRLLWTADFNPLLKCI